MCIHFLCLHPDVYAIPQKDVDKYYEEHSILSPIYYSQTQEIPYLQAVVK